MHRVQFFPEPDVDPDAMLRWFVTTYRQSGARYDVGKSVPLGPGAREYALDIVTHDGRTLPAAFIVRGHNQGGQTFFTYSVLEMDTPEEYQLLRAMADEAVVMKLR